MKVYFSGCELLGHAVFKHKAVKHGMYMDKMFTFGSLSLKEKKDARKMFKQEIANIRKANSDANK